MPDRAPDAEIATIDGAHVAGRRGPHRFADPGQAGRRRDHRRQRDQHGADPRPGGRGGAVRRRVQRRHVLVGGEFRKRDWQAARPTSRGAVRWCSESRDHLLAAVDGGRGSGVHDRRATSSAAAEAGLRPRPAAGRPAPTGLPALVRRRRGTPAPCTPGSGSARSSPAARCRRTCTPSRRASTSLEGSRRARHRRGLVPARAGRLRRCSRSGCRTRWRNVGATDTRVGPRCRRRRRGPGYDDDTCWCRRSAPTSRSPVDVRDPRTRRFGNITPGAHGRGAAEPGAARGLGEHAHGPARLQRHHREDDGRLRPRRAAVDDVHGAVRAGRARPARTTTRSRRPTCPRGHGRGDVRRRDLPARARATSRGPASAACTASATSATGPLRWLETQSPQPPGRHSLPVRPRLGLPARSAGEGRRP